MIGTDSFEYFNNCITLANAKKKKYETDALNMIKEYNYSISSRYCNLRTPIHLLL